MDKLKVYIGWKWKKLCRGNKEGGIRFRNVEDFNTTLLAKQLWQLIEAPDSHFAKVFKSRYFRNSNPHDPVKSYSPSFGRRNIILARPLVKMGLN